MAGDDGARVFRVTVRGQFHELTDRARRYLVEAQPDHDIFRSAYTAEGTFTYDGALKFFNLRYEVRLDSDEPTDAAGTKGLEEAEAFLNTMGFGHRSLRVAVVDMAAMTARRKP
ncbi:MAG TPA: DUF6204 family protein [Acidimicrobiales bacterium]